jgi:CDP-6-deoxy-D-xylo-4-hexulose-3-dehydrase
MKPDTAAETDAIATAIHREGQTGPAHLRSQIFSLVDSYFDALPRAQFKAGDTFIPASGKVLDGTDLRHLVDAALDLWLTSGRFTDSFEAALAERIGVRYARMTVSGSAANLLAFSALTSHKLRRRIRPGDEVITVAAGFPTTIAPIVQNRCVPVFVDIDPRTLNIDIDRLSDAVGPKTRAIMLAHTLGNPFNLDAVSEVAKQHNLFLIEDCCDALGSTYRGRAVGTFGDIGTLSFYPAHHITTGEGGAVFTSRHSLKILIESFRDWGRDCWCRPGDANTCNKRFEWKLGSLPLGYDHKYIYSHLGYNLKATDLQAAIGLSQLAKLDGFVAARRENFAALSAAFVREGLDEHFQLTEATAGSEPSWFGFPLTIRDGAALRRIDVIRYLEDRKVGTRLVFAGNITRQPAFRDVEYRVAGPLTATDKVMNDTFWVGVWPGIGHLQRDYMVEIFRKLARELTA